MTDHALDALSPLDGRYARAAAPLREYFSEAGLIRERIRVEALWLLQLAEALPALTQGALPDGVRACAAGLAADPGADAAAAVKLIESHINHDVKAVEYHVRDMLAAAGAAPRLLELVHFGCTSEDANNLCHARLLAAARARVLLPAIAGLRAWLVRAAHEHAALPMLARTHGQPASPTTLGKEFANVAARLGRAAERLERVVVLAKWNGAVGNFNAHHAALPAADWPAIGRAFVESQGLAWNAYSTQIEPHDWIGEYCDACAGLNTILIDLCRDLWGYISLGYLRQRAVAGEVGSSTMPHKVNPIDFENAEGNFGLASALLTHLSQKLPISRWQRDLTDSTVLRNMGVALGHAVLAWQSLLTGLNKLELNEAALAADLDNAWEVLAEPIQTVMRRFGVPGAYEKLKEATRGQQVTREALHGLIRTLDIPTAEKERLLALTPATYVGMAAELARRV